MSTALVILALFVVVVVVVQKEIPLVHRLEPSLDDLPAGLLLELGIGRHLELAKPEKIRK